jgi:hypothetical protein
MASASEPSTTIDEITAQLMHLLQAAEELKKAIRALAPVDKYGRDQAIQEINNAMRTALTACEKGRELKGGASTKRFEIDEICIETYPCQHMVVRTKGFESAILNETFGNNEALMLDADQIINLCDRMGVPVPSHFAQYVKKRAQNSLRAEADR